jgi:hypothetical protein
MREFPSCLGACREDKVELVGGHDYDALVSAAERRRSRISSLAALIDDIGRSEPRPEDLETTYESLRERARRELREVRPEPADDLRVEMTAVWRCPECGGLDAPQPCIDVCIWRAVEWVSAQEFEAELARSQLEIELERFLVGLLTRFAFVTPRQGETEANWQAFRDQARLALSRPAPAV